MKEVEKKHTPEISGGHADPLVTDPPVCIPEYPTTPLGPMDQTQGERDLPSPL